MILEIIVAILIVVGAIIGYRYIYGIWPGSRVVVEDPPESAPKVSPGNANFMFFYTTWCPYSKDATEPWNSFKQMMKNTPMKYGGRTITFEDIDAEEEYGRATLYQIKEYPTFKLQTSDKVYKLCGKPSVAVFRAFLKSALGSESS